MLALVATVALVACTRGDPPQQPLPTSSISGHVSLAGPATAEGTIADGMSARATSPVDGEIVPGMIVVQMREEVADRAGPGRMLEVGGRRPDDVEPGLRRGNYRVTFAGLDAAATRQAAAELTARPHVAIAEAVPVVTSFGYPNDPLHDDQWAHDLIGIAEAWAHVGADTGSVPSSTIAIVDTGAQPHPDLALLPGWNLIDGNTDVSDPSEDGFSHGTHVAGSAAAKVDNGYGVAGVHPNGRILPVRVLDGEGNGNLWDVARGIQWASGAPISGAPTNANPAPVINVSAGGTQSECPWFIQEAIDVAYDRGSIVVAAAGNTGVDASSVTPANCSKVVTVGSVGPDGRRAPYSNYGTSVDIMATGGNHLLTSYPRNGMVLSTDWDYGNDEPTFSAQTGTSMAAPHVSGALALLRSIQPTLSPSQAVAWMVYAAVPMDGTDCSGLDPSNCGAGLLDVAAMVTADTPPPDQPTIHVIAAYCTNAACTTVDAGRSRQMSLPPGATAGPFAFTQLPSGTYEVLAFLDREGNGRLDPGDPRASYPELLELDGGARSDIDIEIPASAGFGRTARTTR